MTDILTRPYVRRIIEVLRSGRAARLAELRWLKEGFCVSCGADPGGSLRCERCRHARSITTRQWKRRRRAKGLCIQCGQKWQGPQVRCDRCRAKNQERRPSSRRAG